jgi:long-chain acyl-CoA synthetase
VTYYGLAEMGHISSLSSKEFVFEGPPEKVNRLRSCGKEAMNVEVRVIDEWGNDVQPGQLGELIAKGDEMMQGYRNAPKATEEAIKQGYLYTGDLATTDEEGYIYLAGRKKDAIITQGKMLLPSEIEEVIYRHPGVSEVAVIGVPDEKLGQAVKAVVVAKEGKITEEEIIELCRQNLPSHAVPKSIDFVESLPKTPSGKVVRYALSEKYTQPS